MNGNAPLKSAPITYVVAIVGALLVVWVLVLAMQRYTRPQPVGANRAAERRKNLVELRAAEAATLNRYDWQDKAKGLVRLTVERAMELTLQEYQNPEKARAALIERVDKATALPPEKPSEFE